MFYIRFGKRGVNSRDFDIGATFFTCFNLENKHKSMTILLYIIPVLFTSFDASLESVRFPLFTIFLFFFLLNNINKSKN